MVLFPNVMTGMKYFFIKRLSTVAAAGKKKRAL